MINSGINTLPPELVRIVLEYLFDQDAEKLPQYALVCTQWLDIVLSLHIGWDGYLITNVLRHYDNCAVIPGRINSIYAKHVRLLDMTADLEYSQRVKSALERGLRLDNTSAVQLPVSMLDVGNLLIKTRLQVLILTWGGSTDCLNTDSSTLDADRTYVCLILEWEESTPLPTQINDLARVIKTYPLTELVMDKVKLGVRELELVSQNQHIRVLHINAMEHGLIDKVSTNAIKFLGQLTDISMGQSGDARQQHQDILRVIPHLKNLKVIELTRRYIQDSASLFVEICKCLAVHCPYLEKSSIACMTKKLVHESRHVKFCAGINELSALRLKLLDFDLMTRTETGLKFTDQILWQNFAWLTELVMPHATCLTTDTFIRLSKHCKRLERIDCNVSIDQCVVKEQGEVFVELKKLQGNVTGLGSDICIFELFEELLANCAGEGNYTCHCTKPVHKLYIV